MDGQKRVKLIKTEQYSQHLRQRCIDLGAQKILISRLQGTDQEKDLTAPANCEGFGRVRHFKLQSSPGWPQNPLPIVPAMVALEKPDIPQAVEAQVFQNSACAWRCWYCFVPDNLLRADHGHSAWFSAEELVEMFLATENHPLILDLSGGSPDLVPEWAPWMMQALKRAGAENRTYLWSDDNLSTTYLFDEVSNSDLDLIRTYRNYGRVCCFKGLDEESFVFNTRASGCGFRRQFEVLGKLLALNIDLYGYVTFTSPEGGRIRERVRRFVDLIQELDELFPLRVVPLQIRVFTPVNGRMDQLRERSLRIQDEIVAAWTEELEQRFSAEMRAALISDIPLRGRL